MNESTEENRHINPLVIKHDVVTPITLLQNAREQGASLEKMEQLMEMQFKWEANEARKAYHQAVADFKSEPIYIVKSKVNTQFGSKYSGIDDLVNTVNPILSKHNLHAHWQIEQADQITVTCILTHSLGHSESVSVSAPPDDTGKGNVSGRATKNPIQAVKSTITYLKIATYEAVTGVASSDDPGDTDGNIPDKSINARQVTQLKKLIAEKNADLEAFLHHFGIEKIEEMSVDLFTKACNMLREKK